MELNFTICGLNVKARHIDGEIDILDVDGEPCEDVSDRDILKAAREELERMRDNWLDGWIAREEASGW